jgi:hypothetical protein
LRLSTNTRSLYVVSGVLLMMFVLTTGSILTYTLIASEIEKGKDRNHLDIVRNLLRDLDTRIRELLSKRVDSSSIFEMNLPKGEIRTSPSQDVVSYSVKTKVSYDPGSTSTLTVSTNENGVLTIASSLNVDLVTAYTRIDPGRYTVSLNLEADDRVRVANWTLQKNTTYPGTVTSSTNNYYTSKMEESDHGIDLNQDGDTADYWLLYLSDPHDDYVFDSVAIHDKDGVRIGVLQEGDSFRLDGIPLTVLSVRERYVVLRYARIRMDVR